MKNLFIVAALLLTSGTINAASIVWYDSKKEGKAEFKVLPSSGILNVDYDEQDRELTTYYLLGNGSSSVSFSVNTKDEALDIIKRFLDPNNNELIELKED